MTHCIEFEGKVVEKAVEKASEALNIPIDKLQYNVISYGSTGIFGLVGAKKAKISVTVHDKPKRTDTKPIHESHRPRKRDVIEGPTFQEDASDPEALGEISPIAREALEMASGPFTETDPDTLPEPIRKGKEVLQHIIDDITLGALIRVQVHDNRVLFKVDGGNSGVLIGKRGQTLEAIQYIAEKVVNRNSEQRFRIQVDVEGYLDNRQAHLKELAAKLAEKTKLTGKPTSIGQMNAHDRRIIHLALKNDPGVRTQSIGEGFYRKLIIFPKKGKRKSSR